MVFVCMNMYAYSSVGVYIYLDTHAHTHTHTHAVTHTHIHTYAYYLGTHVHLSMLHPLFSRAEHRWMRMCVEMVGVHVHADVHVCKYLWERVCLGICTFPANYEHAYSCIQIPSLTNVHSSWPLTSGGNLHSRYDKEFPGSLQSRMLNPSASCLPDPFF